MKVFQDFQHKELEYQLLLLFEVGHPSNQNLKKKIRIKMIKIQSKKVINSDNQNTKK